MVKRRWPVSIYFLTFLFGAGCAIQLAGCDAFAPPPDEPEPGTERVVPTQLSGTIDSDVVTAQFNDEGVGQAIVLKRVEVIQLMEKMGIYNSEGSETAPAAKRLNSEAKTVDLPEIISLRVGVEVKLGVGGISLILQEFSYVSSNNGTLELLIQVIVRDNNDVIVFSGMIRITIKDITSGSGAYEAAEIIIACLDEAGAEVHSELHVKAGLFPVSENRTPIAVASATPTAVEKDGLVILSAFGSADPDGDALTFQWTQTGGTPEISISGAGLAEASIVAPDVPEDTVFEFTVSVGDGTSEASATTQVTVKGTPVQENLRPVASAGPDQVVSSGTTVTLDGSGSTDPDDDELTFSWKQISGPTVSLGNENTQAANFLAIANTGVETLEFELTVSDGELAATDSTTITVSPNGGGGGGGEVTEPDLLSVMPADALLAIAVKDVEAFVIDIENLLSIDLGSEPALARTLSVLSALTTKEAKIDVPPFGLALAIEIDENTGAITIISAIELDKATLINLLQEAFPEDFVTSDEGDGVTRVDLVVRGIDNIAPFPVTVYIAATNDGGFTIASITKADTLAAIQNLPRTLHDEFESGWLTQFDNNRLMIYLDFANAVDILTAAFNVDVTMLKDICELAYNMVTGTDSICVGVSVADPISCTVWQRTKPDSELAASYAEWSVPSEPMLMGLPNESFIAVEANSQDLTATFAPLVGYVFDADARKMESIINSSQAISDLVVLNRSLSSQLSGTNGLYGNAGVITVDDQNDQTDDASTYLTLWSNLGYDFKELILPADAADLVIWELSSETAVGGRPVYHFTVNSTMLLGMLAEGDRPTALFILNTVFGPDLLLTRIAKVDENHLAYSTGGGLARLNTIVELAAAEPERTSPLDANSLIVDVRNALPGQPVSETFIAPGQALSIAHRLVNAMTDINWPFNYHPGDATGAIGRSTSIEGNCCRNDLVMSWGVIEDVAPLVIEYIESLPQAIVTSPTENTVWTAGETATITWTCTSVNTSGTVTVQLLRDGEFVDQCGIALMKDGRLDYDVPSRIGDGDDYTIRLIANGNPISGISDSEPFSITGSDPLPTITFTSPASGTTWTAGAVETITYTATNPSDDVSFSLYRGDSILSTIAYRQMEATGSIEYYVPDTIGDGDGYRVKASWAGDFGNSVESFSEPFSITGSDPLPTLNITNPGSGTTWTAGTTQTISYTATNHTGNVEFRLFRGETYVTWFGSRAMEASGSIEYDVPETIGDGDNYRVEIAWYDSVGNTVEDRSEPFSITGSIPFPTFEITSPVSGATWTAGTTETVTYTATNPSGTGWISLFSGNSFVDEITEQNINIGATGSIDYDIPADIAGGSNYRIRIHWSNGVNDFVEEYSDTFSIVVAD